MAVLPTPLFSPRQRGSRRAAGAAGARGFFAAWALAGLCVAGHAQTPPAAAPAPRPTLVLAAEDDAAPWSYADGSGYVNDLVRAVFAEAGWALQLKVMPYARCKAQAIAGTVAGCFSASRTPELETQLLYPALPVFEARNVLIVAKASAWTECRPPAGTGNAVIGLVRGYEYTNEVAAIGQRPGTRVELTDSEAHNLRKLRAGRLDAAVVNVDEVKRLDYLLKLAGLPDAYRSACELGALPAYVAFSRAHPQGLAARQAYDAAKLRLLRDGRLQRLQAAWRQRAWAQAAPPAR